MVKYIKRKIRGYFFEIDTPLDPKLYFIGKTVDDFFNDAFIMVTEEMDKFIADNPHASIHEIINCQMDPKNIKQEENETKDTVNE